MSAMHISIYMWAKGGRAFFSFFSSLVTHLSLGTVRTRCAANAEIVLEIIPALKSASMINMLLFVVAKKKRPGL